MQNNQEQPAALDDSFASPSKRDRMDYALVHMERARLKLGRGYYTISPFDERRNLLAAREELLKAVALLDDGDAKQSSTLDPSNTPG